MKEYKTGRLAGILPDVLTTPIELRALATFAAQVQPPDCIVELGVFRGGSLSVLAKNAKPNVQVFGVDLFGGEGTPEVYQDGGRWTRWWSKFSEREFDWEDNEYTARTVAPTANIIVGDTAETGSNWHGPEVGLLFIDADHSAEGVLDDWESWRQHLARNATVIFDDYHRTKYPGITFLVDEILGFRVEVVGKMAVIKP